MTPTEQNKNENYSKHQNQEIDNEKLKGYLNTFVIHGLSTMFNKNKNDKNG